VIGGGNIVRGGALAQTLSVARPTADYIGMLATIQNALVLRDYFRAQSIDARVASSIAMPQICESYIPQQIIRHLEKGRVIIFAAGLGAPYFTTDTTAVQRGLELYADHVVFVKNGVDALYDADPKLVPTAVRVRHTTAAHVIEKNLRVLDLSAVALAREHRLTLRIIGMGNMEQVLNPEFGTTIVPE
jgi:uridylate kinase